MAGARPPPVQPEEFEPAQRGWQHEAASRVERAHRETQIFPRMTDAAKALVRSHGGPGAGLALLTCPTCRLTTIDSHLFRVILLRRLHMPLPPTVRSCRCGRLFDSFGHHRAACARAGVLGTRGYALESAAARICREAGGRVTTNVLVRELDLIGIHPADERRLEVVVDGLPLHAGVQLAIDTTLVGALRGDATARRGAAVTDGVALAAARRRKERRYPELVGPGARSRLVVLGVEVGGRFSAETTGFLGALAKAKSRGAVPLLRKRAEWSWRLRWGSILSCAAARAVASSLLELPRASSADGDTPPSHEVERDLHVAGRLL